MSDYRYRIEAHAKAGVHKDYLIWEVYEYHSHPYTGYRGRLGGDFHNRDDAKRHLTAHIDRKAKQLAQSERLEALEETEPILFFDRDGERVEPYL